MYKVMRFILIIPFLFLAGCSFIPEKVNLSTATLPNAPANIGHGKTVTVSVIDGRLKPSLGGRASGYGQLASITIGNDIVQVVHNSIFDGLKSYGFNPVDASINSNSSDQLTLKIVDFNYQQNEGWMSSDIIITSIMLGTANNNGKMYTHTYTATHKKIIHVVPTSAEDSRDINAAFTDTLTQILTDKNLMLFLAK